MTLKQREREIEKRLQKCKKAKWWKQDCIRRLSKQTSFAMSKTDKEEAIDFFAPYIHLKNTNEHEFYTGCTGAFYKEYIPDWVYYAYIDPYYNNWEMANFMDNKCFYELLFPKCKHLYNLAYRSNGIWFSHDRKPIDYKDALAAIDQEESVFVKKAVISNGGHGVSKLSGDNLSEKVRDVISNIKSDIVIQRSLKQSAHLAAINPSSVNTIRVLSVLRNNEVKIYSMILRMGVGDAYVDNASSGGITVGIREDGNLKQIAYSKDGEVFHKHPTSGIEFDTIRIPNIDAVRKLVVENHPMVPYHRMVSWDVALDEKDTPVLVEANLRDGELDFHQLNNGPVFGKDTESILREVFQK